jgi:hypothetical protein
MVLGAKPTLTRLISNLDDLRPRSGAVGRQGILVMVVPPLQEVAGPGAALRPVGRHNGARS